MDIIFREYGTLIRQKWGWFFVVMLGISGGAGLDLLVPLYYKEIANGLSKPFSAATHTLLLENLGYIAFTYGLIWLSWRALELGEIDGASYENYLKMEKEKTHFESTVAEKRKKDKDFGKMLKNYKKDRHKNKD